LYFSFLATLNVSMVNPSALYASTCRKDNLGILYLGGKKETNVAKKTENPNPAAVFQTSSLQHLVPWIPSTYNPDLDK